MGSEYQIISQQIRTYIHRGIEKCSDVVVVVYIHVDRGGEPENSPGSNFQLANTDVNEQASILAESYFVASSANRHSLRSLAARKWPAAAYINISVRSFATVVNTIQYNGKLFTVVIVGLVSCSCICVRIIYIHRVPGLCPVENTREVSPPKVSRNLEFSCSRRRRRRSHVTFPFPTRNSCIKSSWLSLSLPLSFSVCRFSQFRNARPF